MNYGTAVFRGKEIIETKSQFEKVLLIRLDDKNINQNYDIHNNLILKLSVMPSQSDTISLPQNEYFYSQNLE